MVGYQSFGTGDWVTQAGAAFSPINTTGKWVNDTSIFGNTAVEGDTVNKFSAEVWNLLSWVFLGFQGETSKGWAYSYVDTETWEPAEMVVASFETKQGDTVTYQPSDGVSGLTMAGQVTDTSKSATWTLEAGEWIGDIMNPYPINTTLADIETFAIEGDTLLVFNPTFWDLDSYVYLGKGNGWAVTTYSSETWEQIQYVETDTTKVVMSAGIGGCFQPTDTDGRTWTVTLGK